MLSLAKIKALSTSGAYGGQRLLTSLSEVTSLSGSLFLSDLENWQGVGDELTIAEVDEIKAIVAGIEYDNMVESGGGVSDYVKIGEAEATADVAELAIDSIDSGDWIMWKLVIRNMLSNYVGNWVDSCELECNDLASNPTYTSYGELNYFLSTTKLQNVFNHPAAVLYYASAANVSGNGVYGHAVVDIFNPVSPGWKSTSYTSAQSGTAAIQSARNTGTNGIFIVGDLTKLLIRPNAGTLWLVGGMNEPPTLNMELYGIRG